MSHPAMLSETAQASTVGFSQFLPVSALTCAPEAMSAHHEFHWLAFVADSPKVQFPVRVECELWRWLDGQWRSVFVPGTRFTPSELHDHGWRYCKPCEPLVTVIRS